MKNFFFIISFFLFSIANGQETYSTYTSSNGVYEIKSSVVIDGKSKGEVYLDLNSDGDASLMLKTQLSRESFLNFINTTFDKFKDWKNTALENSVTDLNKDINSERVGDGLAFRYGSWQFNFSPINLKAAMSIDKEGKVVYYLYFPKVESSSNEYIESDSQLLVMYEKDINSLNTALSENMINEYLDSKSSKDDLFN